MDLVVFNRPESNQFGIDNTLAIRLGFMLGKEVVLGGSICAFLIHFEGFNKDANIEFRASALLDHNMRQGDQENVENINAFLDLLKWNKKNKHRSGAQIANYKRAERVVNELFENMMMQDIENAKSLGLVQLRPLADKQYFFYVDIQNHHNEDPAPKNGWEKVSTILKFATDEYLEFLETKERKDWNDKMFILFSNFFNYEEWNDGKKYIAPNHPDAQKGSEIVLQKVTALPNISTLTAIELEVIRNELKAVTDPWNTDVDQWIAKCKKHETDALDFFINKIATQFDTIKNAFANSEQIQEVISQTARAEVLELYMGMMPVRLFIKYLAYYSFISAESAEVFEQYLIAEKIDNMRIPIAAIKILVLHDPTSKTQEPPILTKKKSLDID